MSKKGKVEKKASGKETNKKSHSANAKKGKIKDATQNENLIKSLDIIDNQWQCTIVMIILENQRLYDTLLLKLNDLPNNFTIVTEQTIGKMTDKKSGAKKSRGSSKISKKSTPKSNKKMEKSKSPAVKSNKEGKDSQGNVKDHKDNKFEDTNCYNTCLSLKRFIINLKDCDVKCSDAHDLNIKNDKLKKIPKDKKGLDHKNLHGNEITSNDNKYKKTDLISHRYILLWGFYDPHMLEELAKLVIPVRAVIHVSEPKVATKHSFDITTNITSESKKKGNEKKANRSPHDKLSTNYNIFLDEMGKQVSSITYLEENKNVLFLNYITMSYDAICEKSNNNFRLNIPKVLHGIKEAWDKFEKFCETIQIQEIPNIYESFRLEDADLYNTMISMIPLECTSIPVILHCILEQVVWWCENSILTNKPQSTDTSSEIHINELSLAENESLLPKLVTKNLTPVIVYEMDDIKLNTFHLDLPEFNFEQITTRMLTTSLVYRLWQRYPPHQFSKSKWYEFQLQKLKSCKENDYFNLSKLYKIHLHQLLMNTLILNICKLLGNNDYIAPDTLHSVESDTFVFSSIKEHTIDKTCNTFVREMICSIIYKVPELSLNYLQESRNNDNIDSLSLEKIEPEHSKPLLESKWYETNELQYFPAETRLQKKQEYKQEKLNRLKSFLLSSEFVNLYEEVVTLERHGMLIDIMKDYDYIEEYNSKIMCQQLQKSFQKFLNVNYEYFAPTDSILLWFNNISENDVILSQNIQTILETPLGFRDFYRYKLKEKINLMETLLQREVHSLGKVNDSIEDVLKQNELFDHSTNNKFYDINPVTVYNLGSLRIEVTEDMTHFVSPDSSNVTIKKINYFDKSTCHFSVTVVKNNTTLSYEIDPAHMETFIEIFITFQNDIKISSSLRWNLPLIVSSENLDFDRIDIPILETLKDDEFKLDCSLTVSLPSGLLVEVVPTDTILGPFYIRQRYLGKGPTCSKIWEEIYRCFLNNGTIIIFRSDSCVDILYSNGTILRCSDFEKLEFNKITNLEENQSDIVKRNKEKEDIDINSKTYHSKVKKENKQNSRKESKGKNKDKKLIRHENEQKLDSLKKKKGKKYQNPELLTEETYFPLTKEIPENKGPTYGISEHSVLSWDGSYTIFRKGKDKVKERGHSLRMAFDAINQELYLLRSDDTSSLFIPECLTVTFPDGSRITSFVKDVKELNVNYDNDGSELDSQDIYQIFDSKETVSSNSGSYSGFGVTYTASIDGSKNSEISEKESSGNENFVFVEANYNLEHNNYATVKYINSDQEAELLLPGNITVKIDKNRLFFINVDEHERIALCNDNYLFFEAQVLAHSFQQSSTSLHFENTGTTPTVVCQTVDSLGNVFSIDDRGNTNLLKSNSEVNKQNSSACSPQYPQNIDRFFVLYRDLTGYEMVHKNQIHHCSFPYKKMDREMIKIPLVKGNNDIFSLNLQTSLNKSKSEQYLMDYIEENSFPSLIRRKDLIKLHEMPITIWFLPELSTVIESETDERLSQPMKMPKAITTATKLRIKKNDIKFMLSFSLSLQKYMQMNEDYYHKYVGYYIDETRKEEVYENGEQHRQNLYDSKSYYLMDNLPAVTIENEYNKLLQKESNLNIQSVCSSMSKPVDVINDMIFNPIEYTETLI